LLSSFDDVNVKALNNFNQWWYICGIADCFYFFVIELYNVVF